MDPAYASSGACSIGFTIGVIAPFAVDLDGADENEALHPGLGRLAGEAVIGDMNASTDWANALNACDAVVHLAARVHVMDNTAEDSLALYRATNTDATLNLARQAAQAGVRRFVFISTINVNGEGRDAAYRETDAARARGRVRGVQMENRTGLVLSLQIREP